MRLLLLLLLATGAWAAAPFPEALKALHDPPEQALPVLRSLRPRFTGQDRLAVDHMIVAIEGHKLEDYLDASVELLRRWSASAPRELEVQENVIKALAGMSRDLESGRPRPELMDEALKRARALAKEHPREVRAQSLLGALLGAANQPPREALTVLARCLELDPKEAGCRGMFQEISRYFLAPRCAAKSMRALEIHRLDGDEVGALAVGSDAFVEVVDLPQGDASVVMVRVREPARLQLARLTTELAAKAGRLVVLLEGRRVLQLSIAEPLDKELVQLPHLRLWEICRDIQTPQLPAAWRKWAD